jgi:hypothetical protein
MTIWIIRTFKKFSPSFSSKWLSIVPILFTLIILPLALEAKVVKGIVLDNATEKPIPNANIILLEKKTINAITFSDSSGLFIFENIILDRFNMIVRRMGYSDVAMGPLLMTKIDTLKLIIRMEVSDVLMNEIVVNEQKIDAMLTKVGFYDRKGTDVGKFIGYKELEGLPHTKASELFKSIPQMMTSDKAGDVNISSSRYNIGVGLWGKELPKLFMYIDGILTDNHNFVNSIDIKDIAGIEFYRSTAIAPLRYSGNSRPGGVLLIWTKRGN